jgi:hypothetical protein
MCLAVALILTSEAFGLFTLFSHFKRRNQERTRFLLNCGALNVSCCCPDQNKRGLWSIYSLHNACVTSVSMVLVVAMLEIDSWVCGRHKTTNVFYCCPVRNKRSIWPLYYHLFLQKKKTRENSLSA